MQEQAKILEDRQDPTRNDWLSRITANDHDRWILLEKLALGLVWFLWLTFYGLVGLGVVLAGIRLYNFAT